MPQSEKQRLVEIHYDQRIGYQQEFQNSRKPKVILLTGFGGGKTFSLLMKLLAACQANKGLPGGLLCPSIQMFKKDVRPMIAEICEENGIAYRFNKNDFVYEFPDMGSTVYVFHAQDDGKSIRGPNLAFMGINEITLISEPTFKAAIARVRLRKAPLRQIFGSGTPEEFNWVYDYFVETPREDTDLIMGDARRNIFVAPDYFEMLTASYDEQSVRQYVMGEFVNLSGNQACWRFRRKKHTDMGKDKVRRIEDAPIWISIDFNVNPLAATLWSRVSGISNDPLLRGKWLLAWGEICIKGANTYDLVDKIKDMIPDWKQQEVVLFPDPAGDARSTRGTRSDIDILRTSGFEDIRYKAAIPSVKRCLQALNNLFDKDRIMINSKRCTNTVSDFERCRIKEGSAFNIDKANLKRSHWVDGTKNMCDYEFPILGRSQHKVIQFR